MMPNTLLLRMIIGGVLALRLRGLLPAAGSIERATDRMEFLRDNALPTDGGSVGGSLMGRET